MSGRDGNFLTRWSRRKRDVRHAEADAVPPLSLATGEEPAVAHLEPATGNPSPDPQGGGEYAQPLPRIEDLTADSDISAFLHENVPQALKMAALRRTWSLDPAIRDYVGPAEYAYDYNTPGAIPGFGPAPGWDAKTAAEFVQKIVNPSVGSAGLPPEPACDAEPATPAGTLADRSPDAALQAGLEAEPTGAVASAEQFSSPIEPASPSPPPDDKRDAPPAPRHGGALPR